MQTAQKNWFVRHWILSSVTGLIIFLIIVSNVQNTISAGKQSALNTQEQERQAKDRVNAIFDIPSITENATDGVIARLGQPTSKSTNNGFGFLVYEKQGEKLTVSYDLGSNKIIDYQLKAKAGEDDFDNQELKNKTLLKLNLTQDTPSYKMDFGQDFFDKTKFINLTVSKVDPLEVSKLQNAKRFADNFVQANLPLKAPKTAEFGTPGVTKLNLNDYEVSSYVDSQNSFGAMLRTYWSMEVKYVGSESAGQEDWISHPENWKVVKVVVDGKTIFGK